jgi:hypothetical protein
VREEQKYEEETQAENLRPHFLLRIVFWIFGHLMDLAIVMACTVASFIALKVLLFGFHETLNDGIISFLKQGLKMFGSKDILLGLYGLFLLYAVFFKIVVGTTIGGLIFKR